MLHRTLTEEFLLSLASPSHADTLGEWDDETRAALAVAIPEMATELLLHRRREAELKDALIIARKEERRHERVKWARRVVRFERPEPKLLRSACQILATHSNDPDEREAAHDALIEMQVAA